MGKDSAVELWTVDAATGQRKVLVNADTLKATMQPEKAKTTQATGLGRVQAENYQWAPGGDSLLFVGSNSLALLDLRTMTPKSLITSESEIEDPKFSPDGKWISFVRDANLWIIDISTGEASYDRRQRGNSKGQAGLGLSRRTRFAHRLLVVPRFFETGILRNGRAPGNALPHHGYEFAARLNGIYALSPGG